MGTDLKIYRKTKDVPLPRKMSSGAAGFDLIALIDKPVWVEPFTPMMIPTGIYLGLPHGTEAQVRPRSRMNALGILVGFGTIDSDYRGEVSVTLINVTKNPYEVVPSDRIAQLVFAQVSHSECTEVDTVEALGKTERGEGGFGSTGR